MSAPDSTRQPTLFLSHGAPPLVDSERWVSQLSELSSELDRPTAILMVSAHWEAAPLTIGSTDPTTPLTYDFWGFPERFYRTTYWSPGAPDLAARVAAMMPDGTAIARDEHRRLDHGAYVPLTVMYPEADIPVLQISLPTLDPAQLLNLGRRLAPLRDEGVLIIGSGFTTHGLPYLTDHRAEAVPPNWSVEFDAWAHERFAAGDVESLIDFRRTAPGMPYAHPTIEHFAPLFVALGASDDPEQRADQVIDGFWMGLAKRSLVLT
ncbi:dioxygenase [Gordonia otitidis]|uniref:dioxygenase family protein n=1 Tax=Gordonia otitidis TaxID=249058 RepID=UPI0023534534|nr:class III extradiol ring-cleavage dioxygenase [Gordonia otitidis]